MISFPNIKINIGLDILERRSDGYHNIESLFYPVNYTDILEILPNDRFELINKGIIIDSPEEKNLCYKAWKLIDDNHKIGPVKIILYKNVPFGTGLGSGSSDAAFTLKMLNEMFELQLSEEKLIEYASQIGADCAFFIKNKQVLATDIGTKFQDTNIDLTGYYLVLCIPDVAVKTANAYKNCKPHFPDKKLEDLLKLPVQNWKDNIKNDFEESIFPEHPILAEIKKELYEKGAIYAQMSGSGSAIYGIFDESPDNININSCKNKIIIAI
ncbi:MAG: 4-(cytidine 5'-diphospho)-2-C-methyl-D-erythritol kinase [Marinilabiliales bacterium]|nr:MAG: 4-(cytidine 5'-diphospho)-2-C-methyl-D-erythritol kinase [Marinilabiliales bacterium]